MSKVKLVSIIVPIYNVEKYLRKCIDSILAQTYTNYELLLIDDGSPDSCGEICKEYLTNARVSYYRKENGGLSDARNYGIDRAKGDYLMFVDSDDYLHPRCLEVLVDLMDQATGVQISSVGAFRVAEDTSDVAETNDTVVSEVIDGRTALKNLCICRKLGVSACGKLYQKSMFDGMRFPVGVLYEDNWTIPYLLDKSELVACTQCKFYYYVQRNNSIMHSELTPHNYSSFEGLERLMDYADHQGNNDLHDAGVCRMICVFFGALINRLVFQDDYYEKARELRGKYRDIPSEGFKNPYLSRVKKVQCFFFLHSLPVLRILMKVYIREFKENA